MKKIAIFLTWLITIVLAVGITKFLTMGYVNDNLYATTTVVKEINVENDTVSVIDFNGNLWTFQGVEDWYVGDYCSIIMDKNGTETIYDDEIFSMKYSGWLDGNFGYENK